MKKFIVEGKFDFITRTIVRDLITHFKNHRNGQFYLPHDITQDEVYDFSNLDTKFNVILDLEEDKNIEEFDVDAEYWDDDQTMYVKIKSNPNHRHSILQDLLKELNQTIRHELEHINQYEQYYVFPKEPKDHEKYYSQPHELDAQRAGFKRRSKKEKVPMEVLVRNWFEKNKNKYKMKPDQVERVIAKILER